MSFGPIKERMRRPIAKVTERRGGGDAIELSHLRPSIGTGCDRQYDWWSRSTKPTGETYPACYCRRVTARQLADTAIAHNRSAPSSPSRSRQRLNRRSNTPTSPPFPPRQLDPLMGRPSSPSKRICRIPCSTSTRTLPRPPFRTLLKPDHALQNQTVQESLHSRRPELVDRIDDLL
jgi:hypothetical protein